jgi:hypothetical protein
MPTPAADQRLELPPKLDVVVVSEGQHQGAYLNPAVPLTPYKARTIIEMIAGRVAVRAYRSDDVLHCFDRPLVVRDATPEKWEFVIGLVVCGLATRYEL